MAIEVKHALCSTSYWNANIVQMEALYGVGNYYTDMAIWETNEQRNLIIADEIAILECYNDPLLPPQSPCRIIGWTCSATQYVHIRAATGHECNGLLGSAYTIANRLYITETFTRVSGIIVDNPIIGDVATACGLRISKGNVLIENCLVIAIGDHIVGRLRGKITNSMFVSRNSGRECIRTEFGGVEMVNCNILHGNHNHDSRGKITVLTNVIGMLANQQDFKGSNITLTTCASSIGLNVPKVGLLPINFDATDFKGLNNFDMRMSLNSRLKEAGTQTTTLTDINGVIRI